MESLKATFRSRRLPTLVAGLAMTLAGVVVSPGGVSDLRITEVNPATGQVEVTHIGSSSFTTASALPFCHSFNYGTSIPSGTTFGVGESKTFTVSGLSSSASDLWLYRDGNFASSASIITGIKYGTSASVGRTSVAVAAGIWPSTSAFISLPRNGESLQPFTIADTITSNWFSGVPNFGTFAPAQIRITSVVVTGTDLSLTVTSLFSQGTHGLEARDALDAGISWTAATATISSNAPGQFQMLVPQPGSGNRFFRVKSAP